MLGRPVQGFLPGLLPCCLLCGLTELPSPAVAALAGAANSEIAPFARQQVRITVSVRPTMTVRQNAVGNNRRGPDFKQALNLGIFYEDNASKKRWVLKLDDPKTLAQIDAVFVTVEPRGGSEKPSGKPLLFSYLRVNPNHP